MQSVAVLVKRDWIDTVSCKASEAHQKYQETFFKRIFELLNGDILLVCNSLVSAFRSYIPSSAFRFSFYFS